MPSSHVEFPQLPDILLGVVIRHVVDHDFEHGAEHTAGYDMAQLMVQLRHIPAQLPQDLENLTRGELAELVQKLIAEDLKE